MKNIDNILDQFFDPDGRGKDFTLPFEYFGVDSFEVAGLRARLEVANGLPVPDLDWYGFRSPADIRNYYHKTARAEKPVPQSAARLERDCLINMPQMAFYGLSENWLIKEMGDVHWNMLCSGLETDSRDLKDELGNRLYASFVRVRYEASHPLNQFGENEKLHFSGHLQRFGSSMFFSETDITCAEKTIHFLMMTTFSYRAAEDNQKLIKGQPRIPAGCDIEESTQMPPFGEEYSQMRRELKTNLNLQGTLFPLKKETLFETETTLNPFRDLNGVNLLYFASYPVINDACETNFIHIIHKDVVRKHWAFEAFPTGRDIFYYTNCNLDDTLIYRTHYFNPNANGQVGIASSLTRCSDGKRMAEIFTIKQKVSS